MIRRVPQAELSPAARRRLVLVLPLLLAAQAISTDLYLPALPAILGDLRTDVAGVQLTLSVFLLGFALAQLVYGPLSDRVGRRPLLILGTGLYALASIACALAASIEQLVLLRLIQAVGACSGVVLGRAVVRDLYEPADAARMLAYLGTAMAVAPMLGPVLGGWLTVTFGWRATFAALAIFGAVALIGVLTMLPETNRRRDRTAIQPAVLLANYAALLRDRRYLAHVGVAACGYSGIFAFISGSSYLLIDVVGLSPDLFGLSFAAAISGWMAGTFLAGRLNRRLGLAGLLRWGATISAATALAGLILALAYPPTVAAIVLPMVGFMVGAGFTLPTAMALAIGPYPAQAGLASALLGFLQLATAALVGVLLSLGYDGSAVPMMAVLAVTALAGVAFRLLADGMAGAAGS